MAERLAAMRSHSIVDERARIFARTLGSRSNLVRWDAQGRIRIQDQLLDFAGIDKQAVLVGAFKRFEIWSPATWDQSGTDAENRFHDAAEYIGI